MSSCMFISEFVDLTVLPNAELLDQTHQLAKDERRIGTLILHRLKEILRRRLFASLGYSSVFTYLVQELKYSEACAFRMNNAMKLLAEVSEVEGKIESGALSVSTVAQVQAYCQAQRKENDLDLKLEGKLEGKKEILKLVEGASKREADKILASLHPQNPLPIRDTKKPVAASRTEIRFVACDELLAKLDRIKNLTAHKKLNPSHAELLDLMAEVVLDKIDPLRKAGKLAAIEARKNELQKKAMTEDTLAGAIALGSEILSPGEVVFAGTVVAAESVSSGSPVSVSVVKASGSTVKTASRYISAKTRALVWARAQGQCCFVNSQSGRRCTEKSGLEIEHKILYGRGGTHELFNLELLCRSHNILAAFSQYGDVMGQYV